MIYFLNQIKELIKKMVERNNNKSVIKILGAGFKSSKYSPNATARGSYLHSIRRRFYEGVLKKGNRSKINYITLSQRISEIRQSLLEETNTSPKYKKYKKEVRQLIKVLSTEVLNAAKLIAKSHNGRVSPEEIEEKLFGGVISFEESEKGEIAGVEIKARIDDIIYLSSGNLKIREFKSNLLLDDEDPSDSTSSYHRDWVQAALYAKILEEARDITCESFEIIYYPNNSTNAYELTDEIRVMVFEFVKENGLDALNFTMVPEFENQEEEDEIEIRTAIKTIASGENPIEPKDPPISIGSLSKPENDDHLGWLNTTKNKPFELKRNGENRMEGYLFPNRAKQVRAGEHVAVEKTDGIRIICMSEEIKSHNEDVKGETKSHNEDVFRIKLNPRYEMLPEGPQYPRPQTITGGKIMRMKKEEYYIIKKIPENGICFGIINEVEHDNYKYYMEPNQLFKSMFIGGMQGFGKTSFIRLLVLSLIQQEDPPAIIIFDAEEEYPNLVKIPTNLKSFKAMKELGLNKLDPQKFELINIELDGLNGLTFKNIDPIHLPLFLHELPPASVNILERIIEDIKNDNPGRTFAFSELETEIKTYLGDRKYRIHKSIGGAIERALLSIALDMFDRVGTKPIQIEDLLKPGKITVINVKSLRDDRQRVVALYLLSLLHKHIIKGNKNSQLNNSGSIFILDEVQRILPRLLSNSAYQHRIIQFLDEITHRGRKRNYGIIYATQSPLDIKKHLVDLCHTKVFFQIHGSSDYLREYLKNELEQLKILPTGVAFIRCGNNIEPVLIKFPYLN